MRKLQHKGNKFRCQFSVYLFYFPIIYEKACVKKVFGVLSFNKREQHKA